VFKDTDLV